MTSIFGHPGLRQLALRVVPNTLKESKGTIN